MKQLFLNVKDGSMKLIDQPMPTVKENMALVETLYTVVSAGTERGLASFGGKNLVQKALERPDQVKKVLEKLSTDGIVTTIESAFNKLAEPMPMGYSGVGRVISCGKGVTEVQAGDLVAMVGTAYHCEINRVSRTMLTKIPEESQKYAAEAIRLVLKEEQAYLANTPEGNEEMLLAANLAGKAINLTQTTAGHAMAYKLTTLYGLAHGHAVALCVEKLWPYMVRHTEDCMDKRGTAYLNEMFRKLADVMGCDSAEAAAEAYGRFFRELSLERPTLQHPGELDVLAGSVNPVRLKNNPVRLDAETLRALYEEILKEK